MGVQAERQVEDKGRTIGRVSSSIARGKGGVDGEMVRGVEEHGGEDMEGREAEVAEGAGRLLQGRVGATHRAATCPPDGDSRVEGDPEVTLEEEKWGRDGAICVDRRGTSRGSVHRQVVIIVGRRAMSRDSVLDLVGIGPRHQGEWEGMHRRS